MSTPRKPVNKWLITLSVSFGTLMGAIDSSIVNVAMPHIRGAVGASVQEITWISTGYALANVLIMPLTAFLARQFGQKRVYMACLVLFLVGSALCGTATSLEMLIFYRALQGFGAGALQPTEQAILRQTFPPKEQGMAMALFGMAVMLGPAVGPTIGGYIVDNYSWPWIFYINLPIGVLGLMMVSAFVHEDEEIRRSNQALAIAQRKNIDWAGIALMSTCLCAIQFFLEEGQQHDWLGSRLILGALVVSIVTFFGFLARELTAKLPVVNLTLFADPVFTSGTLIGSVMWCMLMANTFLLPMFMEEVLGYTATQSGLAMMPRVIVMMVMTPMVGRLYSVVPVRVLIIIGVLVYSAGAFMMGGFSLEMTQTSIINSSIIQGVGFSFLFVPLTTAALGNVPKHKISDATGLNSLMRQVGGSVGTAAFATLLERHTTVARYGLVPHLAEGRTIVTERLAMMAQPFVARGMAEPDAKMHALAAMSGIVERQATLLSFLSLFVLSGLLFLLILPLLIFLRSTNNGPVKPMMEH